MPEAEIPAWVDSHWEAAAAEIEAGIAMTPVRSFVAQTGGKVLKPTASGWLRSLEAVLNSRRLVLYCANDCREDCAANAAADHLRNDRANVEITALERS